MRNFKFFFIRNTQTVLLESEFQPIETLGNKMASASGKEKKLRVFRPQPIDKEIEYESFGDLLARTIYDGRFQDASLGRGGILGVKQPDPIKAARKYRLRVYVPEVGVDNMKRRRRKQLISMLQHFEQVGGEVEYETE